MCTHMGRGRGRGGEGGGAEGGDLYVQCVRTYLRPFHSPFAGMFSQLLLAALRRGLCSVDMGEEGEEEEGTYCRWWMWRDGKVLGHTLCHRHGEISKKFVALGNTWTEVYTLICTHVHTYIRTYVHMYI